MKKPLVLAILFFSSLSPAGGEWPFALDTTRPSVREVAGCYHLDRLDLGVCLTPTPGETELVGVCLLGAYPQLSPIFANARPAESLWTAEMEGRLPFLPVELSQKDQQIIGNSINHSFVFTVARLRVQEGAQSGSGSLWTRLKSEGPGAEAFEILAPLTRMSDSKSLDSQMRCRQRAIKI